MKKTTDLILIYNLYNSESALKGGFDNERN